jgi:hypothetical protein
MATCTCSMTQSVGDCPRHDAIEAADIVEIFHADVPVPAGATRTDPWMEWSDGTWLRAFRIEQLRDGRLIVDIGGMQETSGTFNYSIDVVPVDALTVEEARALAVMLATAAKKVTQLIELDPPFM